MGAWGDDGRGPEEMPGWDQGRCQAGAWGDARWAAGEMPGGDLGRCWAGTWGDATCRRVPCMVRPPAEPCGRPCSSILRSPSLALSIRDPRPHSQGTLSCWVPAPSALTPAGVGSHLSLPSPMTSGDVGPLVPPLLGARGHTCWKEHCGTRWARILRAGPRARPWDVLLQLGLLPSRRPLDRCRPWFSPRGPGSRHWRARLTSWWEPGACPAPRCL